MKQLLTITSRKWIRSLSRKLKWKYLLRAHSSKCQYICHATQVQLNFTGEVVRPLNKDNLRFPISFGRQSRRFSTTCQQLTHFELAYQESTHYDSIIDVESGTPSDSMPRLTPRRPLADISNCITIALSNSSFHSFVHVNSICNM